METVINGIGFFATGSLLGAMAFFSGVMAPLSLRYAAGTRRACRALKIDTAERRQDIPCLRWRATATAPRCLV